MHKQVKISLLAVLLASGVTVCVIILLISTSPPGWEIHSPPDLHGPEAMEAVNAFVATNGWNMVPIPYFTYGGEERLRKIRGLPWKRKKDIEYWAVTSDGILYVLLDHWHHDVIGVAYNPKTNRFPGCVSGFKPLRDHWYVWAQPEFPSKLRQEYEGGK